MERGGEGKGKGKGGETTCLTSPSLASASNTTLEIPHRPTNSMETARSSAPTWKLISAFLAPHDDSTRKFNRETFSDGGLLQDKPILITTTL